ncbi:putative kinase [Streptomyces umbrinus]|uniref:Kinase n=1 Tax=Streptomyces umbrinus TaxID=67370 RepID=A0ABU0SHY2_9ACTN|nr:putative kinase [Streptomyces umbrinus]
MIAESVNPLTVTRNAWRDAAVRAGVPSVEVVVVCSDPVEHRRRVTSRSVDIPDLALPDWQQILDREYEHRDRDRVVVDTVGQNPKASSPLLLGAVLSAAAAGSE